MRTIPLLLTVLLLGACGQSIPTGSSMRASLANLKPCPEEADTAVLDVILPRLTPTYNSANSASEMSHGELDAWQSRINCLRPWAAGLKDPCQQAAANHWLDFNQGELNECRDIVRRGTSDAEQRQAEYEQQRQADRQRVMVYCKTNPVPEPPQCAK